MFALLKAIPLRWWLYVAGVAAIAFVLWHDHHLAGRLRTVKAEKVAIAIERDQLAATIETMKADATLNKVTTHALVKALAAVPDADPAVSVRCEPATRPVSAEGRAAGGADAAPERGGAAPALRDIGAALEAARVEAQRNNARFVTLQSWEAARTH